MARWFVPYPRIQLVLAELHEARVRALECLAQAGGRRCRCGVLLDAATPGCKNCTERHRQRRRRLA